MPTIAHLNPRRDTQKWDTQPQTVIVVIVVRIVIITVHRARIAIVIVERTTAQHTIR